MSADAQVAAVVDQVRIQFAQQIQYLRDKLNLPTEHWLSIERAAHDRAFVVAGAMKADLLADLRRAVDASVRGASIDKFRKEFKAIVAKHGWTGWTGEDSEGGVAWRTSVIYRTNITTSYAAGRWKQLKDPEVAAVLPWWRYVHSGNFDAREHHKAWGNQRLTLRHDDPFWQTHYPPNGWGCGCYILAVEKPDEGAVTEPPPGWNTPDPRTGALVGVDSGWDYAPGARTDDELRTFVQDKLITYPPAIERALSAELKKHLNATQRIEEFVSEVLADRQRSEDLWIGFVDRSVEKISKLTNQSVKGYVVLLPANQVQHVWKSHEHDGDDQRPAQARDYARLIEVLETPDSMTLSSEKGIFGEPRVLVKKRIGGETLVAVFEIRSGKRNRALSLYSFWVKTQ